MALSSSFFRVVSVSGTSVEMGVAYGRQTADLIQELVLHSEGIYRKLGYSETIVQEIRERHEDGILDQCPEIIDEIKGMAEGARVSYEHLMDACLHREIRKAFYADQDFCTTCLIARQATSTGKPLIGHNWDSRGDQNTAVVTVAKPENGLRFVTVGPVARPGCEGMNERGLTMFMTGVNQRKGTDVLKSRGPLYVPPSWTHHILKDSANLDDVLHHCKHINRSIHGMTWEVGDPDDFFYAEIACDEVNVSRLDPDKYEQDWITSITNHYVSPKLKALGLDIQELRESYDRRERMIKMLRSNIGKLDLCLVQSLLRNHDAPNPICRHSDSQSYTTISSEIGEPRDRRFWIAFGPPCRSEYRAFIP